jgi:2-oxo-3-hexenedioate decarboxylase
MSALREFATRLDGAATARAAIPQLSSHASLSVGDAYDVQRELVGQRLGRGERLVGVKLGFTSRAKMLQMGVSDLIWGRLTSGMLLEEGGRLRTADYIHPRIEPEIAFVLRQPLAGRVTAGEALAAVGAVAPALEVIDSRYADFRFNLADVVADNCSSAGVVIGPWRPVPADLDNLGVELWIDGRISQCGSTAAILGDPVRALVAAARLAAEAGLVLEPGWIVMAGAATAAEALAGARHARVAIEGLGGASIHVDKGAARA